jgi:hypothetical protein
MKLRQKALPAALTLGINLSVQRVPRGIRGRRKVVLRVCAAGAFLLITLATVGCGSSMNAQFVAEPQAQVERSASDVSVGAVVKVVRPGVVGGILESLNGKWYTDQD